MALVDFSFNPALTDDFIRFGYDVYRGDPNWIAPFRTHLRAQFMPTFSFYQKPGNCHRHFLAKRGDAVNGRVSAMVNGELRDKDGTPVGTIGFFECIDDLGVAQELLSAAVTWLQRYCGIRRIWGPMNFDIWHGYRLMTRGFDENTFYGEPYNKPYYPAFFHRFGFTERKHWYSVELSGRETLERMIALGGTRYEQLVERGYRFDHLNMRRFREGMCTLHAVLTQSFCGFLGFTPISCDDFERLFATSRRMFDPRLCIFVYDENDRLAGFAGAFRDFSDGIRVMRGEDTLVAKLRFRWAQREAKRVLFYLGGMTVEEARRGSGLGRAGLYYVIRQMLDAGCETVLFAMQAEGSPVRALMRGNAAQAQRQYTLYEVNV